MIIMINGAFGVGKTTTASQLQSRIPNSMIFDPELIGYLVREMVPHEIRWTEEQTDDFQDIELWRILTVQAAVELKHKYHRHLIIPMTIYKTENFDHIYTGLKRLDQELYHFCLTASDETIHQRLMHRGDLPGSWAYQQTIKCTQALATDKFAEHIVTDHQTTEEIVEYILMRMEKKYNSIHSSDT